MTRCPNTTTPRQHLGRKRYRLARRTMRCVLEEGHAGPCAWEPSVMMTAPSVVGTNAATLPPMTIVQTRTPEQIAEADARYREHLRRKRWGR